MKKRILIIDNSVAVTGALKSVAALSTTLGDDFDFFFVIPKNADTGPFLKKSARAVRIDMIPMVEISRSWKSLLAYFPMLFINAYRLKRLVRENSISLIHVNDIYNLLTPALRLMGNRTPYICYVRFLPNRFPGLLLKFWFVLHARMAEKIIAVSYKVKSLLPAHQKVIVVYDRVPDSEQYPWPSTNKHKHFLFMANFTRGKGQNFAVEAFIRVHTILPGWKLRFVGGIMGLQKNADFRDELKMRVSSAGLEEKVEWSEFTNDVELEYKHAEIVLNFSESESFSKTCLEAMYFGTAVVATDCGGPAEIIENNVSGILIENKNIDAMAEAMQRLANDESLRSRLATTARLKVREKFDTDITTFRLKKIYQQSIQPSV
jgi:glycosyltransferase involved in cell wall biosynthesis